MASLPHIIAKAVRCGFVPIAGLMVRVCVTGYTGYTFVSVFENVYCCTLSFLEVGGITVTPPPTNS